MANKIEKQFLDTENKGPVRLNKYLSEAGVCSRREADKLIAAGQVTVDGVRAETGMKVEPWQVVRIGKKQVSRQEEMIVLAVNKPRGIVCTEERRERDSIVRFLNYPVRITYVGRLDKDSEGLLLMTNNGDIINQMMRAANKHEKEYKVTVDKPVTDEFLKEMAGGVPILDTVTRPCQVEKLGKYKFKIILTQGLNRQIRRMCEALGYRRDLDPLGGQQTAEIHFERREDGRPAGIPPRTYGRPYPRHGRRRIAGGACAGAVRRRGGAPPEEKTGQEPVQLQRFHRADPADQKDGQPERPRGNASRRRQDAQER